MLQMLLLEMLHHKGEGDLSGRSVLLLSRSARGQGHAAQIADKKKVIDSIEQEYLAYLFLNNSNAKMHSQLQKDVANDYQGEYRCVPQ